MGTTEPSLFGIVNSNRGNEELWGKNQFNSSFPVALACYMQSKAIQPMYLKLESDLSVSQETINVSDIFNSTSDYKKLHFHFESKFEPYQGYAYDNIGGIDLVVKSEIGEFLAALEIKLTVLPDSGTAKKSLEDQWGSELVIRPATTKYCALSIAHSIHTERETYRPIFEKIGASIKNWGNPVEISSRLDEIKDAVNKFEISCRKYQRPLLLQPIWKTKGQTPILADNAFDIFVWSDFALTRLFIDTASCPGGKVNRQARSLARLFRFLYHYTTSGKVGLNDIYTEMTFELQTDKEFAINGSKTNSYMSCDRLVRPIIKKSELKNIILGGGEKMLKPERRFDQTLYYTVAETINK